MLSANLQVNNLHEAYCEARGLTTEDLPMNMTFERWWLNALQFGVTPDDLKLCMKGRIRFNQTSSLKKALALHSLIKSEDAVAVVVSEAAEERARMRKPTHGAGKSEVLNATGRGSEIAQPDARPAREIIVNLADQMRRAAS